jgi:hypothetical protein
MLSVRKKIATHAECVQKYSAHLSACLKAIIFLNLSKHAKIPKDLKNFKIVLETCKGVTTNHKNHFYIRPSSPTMF